ncbi:MAG: hypothetical protein JRC69_11520 [Deltaproteobacteria bacterium]|nr:hypothetical protein [Deltaproteobacteria bacterium]
MNILTKTVVIFASATLLLSTGATLHAADQPAPAEYSSVEERRLLHIVSQERASIRKEQEEIVMKKKELKTLGDVVDKKLAEIDNKLEELRKLQNKIELLLTAKSAEEKKRLKGLASIYEKMTPEKASLALTGLDQQLAADLLANMRVKAAAKILDQISNKKAAQLSTTFSTIQLE